MDLSTSAVATALTAALVLIAAVVGGVVVITDPETLTFKEYLDKLGLFAVGVGLLGVGRGIAARR